MGSVRCADLSSHLNKDKRFLTFGTLPVQPKVYAMRIGWNDGHLVFQGETRISLLIGRKAEPYVDLQGMDRTCQWWRWAARVSSPHPSIQAGDYWVVAQFPYSSGWCQQVPFKRCSKKSPTDAGQRKSAPLRPQTNQRQFASQEELLAWIECLSHDYWETGSYLTAGISIPESPTILAERRRNRAAGSCLVFGTCEDAPSLEQELYASAEIQEIMERTAQNTFRFWFLTRFRQTIPRLRAEVIEQRYQLMWLSVRQAFAGPHKLSRKWTGRPVVQKVVEIYRDHLNNRNRADFEREHLKIDDSQ